MKDGYYISAYLHIDEIAHLYHFHIRHDQNISLWRKNGESISLIHVWELERITGLKKCNRSFANIDQVKKMISQLLESEGLAFDDIEQIFGTPGLDTCSDYHSGDEYPSISYHSISHMFSALLANTDVFYKEKIIAVAVDGGPDSVVDEDVYGRNYYCGAYVDKGEVHLFPISSPGFFWTYTRKLTGMEEGSLMALASASKSELLNYDDELIEVYGLSDLKKAYQYILQKYDEIMAFSKDDIGKKVKLWDERFSDIENRYSMLAKLVQKISLRIMEENIEKIVHDSGFELTDSYLAISGGYGLNCPTNSYLMNKYKFKGFLSIPGISDAGISVGMGLYYFYKKMKKIEFRFSTPFVGDQQLQISDEIFSKYKEFINEVSEYSHKKAVEDIMSAPIVWFYGKSELGPRALGHRSIIGNPLKEETRDALNVIKQRQWWRPVAPIVMADKVDEWFEDSYYSPYMLHTMNVRGGYKEKVPAILHLDGSARVQTLTENDDMLIYDLLREFYNVTGVPMLCNTSLNDKGEPIINSVEECLNFALRKKIKIVYLNGKRISLKCHENYLEKLPQKRKFTMELWNSEERKNRKKTINPYQLQENELIFLFLRPELRKKIDLHDENDVKLLKKYRKVARIKMGSIPIPGLEKEI